MDDRALALESLYRRRYTRFRNALTAVVGTSDAARDVVQEAFARAYANRTQLRDVEAIEAWVWRIALRTAREQKALSLQHLEFGDGSAITLEIERDEALAAALRSLPERRRLMVFLYYYADLPYATVAALCEVTPGTVAAALAQAKDALRLHLRTERNEA
jgi:RNA polymerase sigma-70 factor, ECF subfamily